MSDRSVRSENVKSKEDSFILYSDFNSVKTHRVKKQGCCKVGECRFLPLENWPRVRVFSGCFPASVATGEKSEVYVKGQRNSPGQEAPSKNQHPAHASRRMNSTADTENL
jgi:hypothetical protein